MAVPTPWTEVLSGHTRNGVVRRDPHARADAAVALPTTVQLGRQKRTGTGGRCGV
jgi:hypothetical protein